MEQPNPTFAKILILDTRKFEQSKFRIQQYLQNEHYALWEVIEFGDSYKAPQEESGTGSVSESSAKKKGRTIALTTEDMQKRRNDVKARTTLLLALLDEHQLRFSTYKTAQELWGAILKTFSGNEATKKTKKNQLKQQYGNFKADGLKILEQTFNRLQAIISHLELMDVEIKQDDLNQKFLTSLAPEWLMYTIVWRNRNDLDTLSLDDVYNHLKVYEPEIQKKSDANVVAASISHDTVCSYIASQSNGPQIKYKDINQIDKDDIKEMDIKLNMALLSMRADRFWKKTKKKITIQGTDVAGFDKSKGLKVEESAPIALMAIDGVRWDWSYMANEKENHALVDDDEAPTEFALMAKSRSSSENEDTVLFPPLAQVYSPSKKDMSWTGLPESADDTITNYNRPSPSIESNSSDPQNSNSSVFEHEESSESSISKPMIKFVKEVDSPTVIKTNKAETVRKPSVKYAEKYRNTSKSPK
nr:hypothetical protein [Tanacetum cinerariifolium]